MAKTSTFTASASPTKTPITIVAWTNRVEIQEDPSVTGWPTTDFLIYAPTASDTAVRYAAGATYVREAKSGPFYSGQIIGYISGVSGSSTFAQVEEGLS